MSQALLAKAVTKDAPTLYDQFLRHVKVTWLTYILEHAKPKPKKKPEDQNSDGESTSPESKVDDKVEEDVPIFHPRIMPAPVMFLIIRFLDDDRWDNWGDIQIRRLANQLVQETQDRSWIDDISPKYVACLLQLACDDNYIWGPKTMVGQRFVSEYLSTNVPRRKSKEFLFKLKVPIQRRIWAKKEFAIKLINPTDRQRKLLEKSKSYADFLKKQHDLKRLYPKQDHLIKVPIFNVFVPKDFHLLGHGLKHYKQLLKKHGKENREAREIRLEFLREANLELRPEKDVFVGLFDHQTAPSNFSLTEHVMPQLESQ